jgi:hypothetical protein
MQLESDIYMHYMLVGLTFGSCVYLNWFQQLLLCYFHDRH